MLENQKKRMEWLESNFQRSNTYQQNPGKIIAAVSPGKDGAGATTRIFSNRSVKESLPRELIEKIKAASQGRKTIAIIEPVVKDGGGTSRPPINRRPGWNSNSRWRHVGVVNPLQHHNSDHDYCSPNKKGGRKMTAAQQQQQQQQQQSPLLVQTDNLPEISRENVVSSRTSITSPLGSTSTRGRDSGLESAEMSDASEDGLYDRLPPYLTSVSVQTDSRSMNQVTADDHGYTRVPTSYLTVSKPVPVQQSLLKSNVGRKTTEVMTDRGIGTHTDQSVTDKREELVEEVTEIKIEPAPMIKLEKRNRRRDDSFSSSSDDEDYGKRSKRRRSRSPRIRVGSRRRSGSRNRRRSRNMRSRSGSRRHGRSSRSYRRRESISSRSNERRTGDQSFDKENEKNEQERRWMVQERQRQVEERRVVYVGGIQEGTLKDDLRKRFQVFGPIVDISVHFRDFGDNYGFVTFQYKVDAYAAVERGNDDKTQPQYDLCFGGRRAFCKERYMDLDDVEENVAAKPTLDFDELLEHAKSAAVNS